MMILKQVKHEEIIPSIQEVNQHLSAIGISLEGYFEVEHGVYYLRGARLVGLDGTPYKFEEPEEIYGCGLCMAPGEDHWDNEKQTFTCLQEK